MLRKVTVVVLCVLAFALAAVTFVLQSRVLFIAGWTEWALGYLMCSLPNGISVMLLAVSLIPWLPGRPAVALALGAFLLAIVSSCHIIVQTAGMKLSTGEVIGVGPAAALLSLSCFVRFKWPEPRATRLWLLFWGAGVLVAVWWSWALLTTEGDHVVGMTWFVYYGPSIVFLAPAVVSRPTLSELQGPGKHQTTRDKGNAVDHSASKRLWLRVVLVLFGLLWAVLLVDYARVQLRIAALVHEADLGSSESEIVSAFGEPDVIGQWRSSDWEGPSLTYCVPYLWERPAAEAHVLLSIRREGRGLVLSSVENWYTEHSSAVTLYLDTDGKLVEVHTKRFAIQTERVRRSAFH